MNDQLDPGLEQGELKLPPPRRWAVVLAAVASGLGTGLLGTSLHGHAWFGNGLVIPVGAAAALVMLAAVELFVGLWSRNAWVVVLCGAAAYLCAGTLSLQLGGFGMISSNLQGLVWLYGIAVVTPLTGLLALGVLRSRKPRK